MTSYSNFALLAILSCVIVIGSIVCGAEARARAFFVFGDSLVDNGNNNYLATTARADAPPYGIDYAPTHRPTGRFSNGYNIPDLISSVYISLSSHIHHFKFHLYISKYVVCVDQVRKLVLSLHCLT